MVICLEQGVDLHMARLMPLPLTVSCFSEIQISFISLVPAHPDSPRKGPLNVCVCLIILVIQHRLFLCGLFTSVGWLLLLFGAFSRRCSTCGREGRRGQMSSVQCRSSSQHLGSEHVPVVARSSVDSSTYIEKNGIPTERADAAPLVMAISTRIDSPSRINRIESKL